MQATKPTSPLARRRAVCQRHAATLALLAIGVAAGCTAEVDYGASANAPPASEDAEAASSETATTTAPPFTPEEPVTAPGASNPEVDGENEESAEPANGSGRTGAPPEEEPLQQAPAEASSSGEDNSVIDADQIMSALLPQAPREQQPEAATPITAADILGPPPAAANPSELDSTEETPPVPAERYPTDPLQEDPLAAGLFGALAEPAESDALSTPDEPTAEESENEPRVFKDSSDGSFSREPADDTPNEDSSDDGSLFAIEREDDPPFVDSPLPAETPPAPLEPSPPSLPATDPPFADEVDTPADNPTGLRPIRTDPKNTRHLAWLLGAKAAVVALADMAGVEGARDRQWEIEALAGMLGVSQPSDLADPADETPVDAAIARLIRRSRTTADELTRRHGDDHAALMEISLKTNALLVLYESRPALAGLVLQAVQQANTRAGLPPKVLAPLVDTLSRRASAEEARRAVHELHRVVEQMLRETPTRSNG